MLKIYLIIKLLLNKPEMEEQATEYVNPRWATSFYFIPWNGFKQKHIFLCFSLGFAQDAHQRPLYAASCITASWIISINVAHIARWSHLNVIYFEKSVQYEKTLFVTSPERRLTLIDWQDLIELVIQSWCSRCP